jgi:hypothetical protein
MKQPKGGDYNISILGLSKGLILFFFCDGPIKVAHHRRKKIEL